MSSKDKRIYLKTKKFLENRNIPNIDEKLKIIESVLEIKDKKERVSYLYDLICDYLDNEFTEKNICDFNCGVCKRRKAMIKQKISKKTYQNGCCYSYLQNSNCQYLDSEKGCQIKNIACKLFTCDYLKKQGYRYKIDDIYFARYFFNIRQKFYIKNTFFVPKDVVLKGILERG